MVNFKSSTQPLFHAWLQILESILPTLILEFWILELILESDFGINFAEQDRNCNDRPCCYDGGARRTQLGGYTERTCPETIQGHCVQLQTPAVGPYQVCFAPNRYLLCSVVWK
jgi:hypothetical protein